MINNWAVTSLFMSYIKRNKAVFLAVFILPVAFLITISANYGTNFNASTLNFAWVIMILFMIQGISFSTQTFLSILLDFKQTVIFRRIGLTRISKTQFLIVASVVNLVLLLMSYVVIFVACLIMALAFGSTTIVATFLSWQILVSIIVGILFSFFITGLTFILNSIINTRTTQGIAAFLVNVFLIAPLFTLVFFLRFLSILWHDALTSIPWFGIVGIVLAGIILLSGLTILVYYGAWKRLKWFQ